MKFQDRTTGHRRCDLKFGAVKYLYGISKAIELAANTLLVERSGRVPPAKVKNSAVRKSGYRETSLFIVSNT